MYCVLVVLYQPGGMCDIDRWSHLPALEREERGNFMMRSMRERRQDEWRYSTDSDGIARESKRIWSAGNRNPH